MPSKYSHHFTALLLLLLANLSRPLLADETAHDWLRYSGKELQIRLQGEVFDSSGQPATDVELTGSLNAKELSYPLEPQANGHRFEVWIPVNQREWYSMWLKAASPKSDSVAYLKLSAYELRQAAIDGVKLTLQSPTRQVQVKVSEAGKPVSGAQVKADLGTGCEVRSQTDADGIARFGLLPEQKLSGLTAWTEDYHIGGFKLNRDPPRDPEATDYEIDLSKCRDLKIRFVDETGSPVPDLEYEFKVATPPPEYNFLGTNEHSQMKTDAQGEAIYRWFPDWEKHHFYADLISEGWVLESDHKLVDGIVLFEVKRSQQRKRVSGRVTSANTGVDGYYVILRSFQGERENYSDHVTCFADSAGRFSADVLPDATYCACVLDAKWVGEIIDLIPYISASDQTTPLELPVLKGQEVDVIVTSGPQKRPYPNLIIRFRREHSFSWSENGKTRHGSNGPEWWATTDESGRASTNTLPVKLKVYVFTPLWRTEKEIDVRSDKDAVVNLHREIEEKRTVTGRLVLADGIDSNLENAEIQIGAVDGNYQDIQTLTCDQEGSFSYETLAAEVGVFAMTQDGQTAGSTIATDLSAPIVVNLRPTMDYHGQLLGEGDQPLAAHAVRATIRIEGNEDYNGLFIKGFEGKILEAKTDAQGNFTLKHVPTKIKAILFADALDHSEDDAYLGEIYLESNETRPPDIHRLAPSTPQDSDTTLAERYNSTLRDCKLNGYHLLAILSSDDESVTKFVFQHFANYEANKQILSFMQLIVSHGQNDLKPGDAAFLQEQGWQLPDEKSVVAYALDAHGNELGHVELDVSDKQSADKAVAFVNEHAPLQVDAEQKWQKALAEANQSNRRVWARISGRYCGPCFRFARWLDDQHEVLDKDYVMLKIDNASDLNGNHVANYLTRGGSYGIPFHAIFTPEGEMLINSAGPLGNVGHPSGFEGKKQLRKMLMTTRQHLTDAEIDQLVESLED